MTKHIGPYYYKKYQLRFISCFEGIRFQKSMDWERPLDPGDWSVKSLIFRRELGGILPPVSVCFDCIASRWIKKRKGHVTGMQRDFSLRCQQQKNMTSLRRKSQSFGKAPSLLKSMTEKNGPFNRLRDKIKLIVKRSVTSVEKRQNDCNLKMKNTGGKSELKIEELEGRMREYLTISERRTDQQAQIWFLSRSCTYWLQRRAIAK